MVKQSRKRRGQNTGGAEGILTRIEQANKFDRWLTESVLCIDRKTGALLWRVQSESPFRPRPSWRAVDHPFRCDPGARLGRPVDVAADRHAERPVQYRLFLDGGGGFHLRFGSWGLATGIGLLRMKQWARVSMLVFAAILVLCSLPAVLVSAFIQFPVPNDGRLPASFAQILRVSMALFYSTLAALGGFWLYFFSRSRVRAQFRAEPVVLAGGAGRFSRRRIAYQFRCRAPQHNDHRLVFTRWITARRSRASVVASNVPRRPDSGMLFGVLLLWFGCRLGFGDLHGRASRLCRGITEAEKLGPSRQHHSRVPGDCESGSNRQRPGKPHQVPSDYGIGERGHERAYAPAGPGRFSRVADPHHIASDFRADPVVPGYAKTRIHFLGSPAGNPRGRVNRLRLLNVTRGD